MSGGTDVGVGGDPAGVLARSRLMVSLPRNDLSLARAAVDAGADAIKVHVHVRHRVSGVSFGTFEEERDRLLAIMGLAVPVGVVVDGRAPSSERESLVAAGAAFLDSFLDSTALDPDAAGDVAVMVAVDDVHSPGLEFLGSFGVDAVEAAIVRPEDYATAPTLGWLARLAHLRSRTPLPIVVPTQHRLRPAHVPRVRAAGASCLLLGAVVTGDTVDRVAEATQAFRQALDQADQSGQGAS